MGLNLTAAQWKMAKLPARLPCALEAKEAPRAASVAADATLTVFGDGLQTRDFIAVSDVARANVAALMGQTLGVVNVATGTSVTLLQLIDALSGLVGRALVVEHAPTRAGEVRESSVTPDRLRRDLGAALHPSSGPPVRTPRPCRADRVRRRRRYAGVPRR